MINPITAGRDLLKLRKESQAMEQEMRGQRHRGKSKKELVEVTIDGMQSIVEMTIDDMLLDPQMKQSLINNIKEAFADAQKAVQKAMQSNLDADKIKSILESLR